MLDLAGVGGAREVVEHPPGQALLAVKAQVLAGDEILGVQILAPENLSRINKYGAIFLHKTLTLRDHKVTTRHKSISHKLPNWYSTVVRFCSLFLPSSLSHICN